MLKASQGGLEISLDWRFNVLNVNKFSKLPNLRLSCNLFPDKSRVNNEFITGQTSLLGISSIKLFDKSNSANDIGNKSILFNSLFLKFSIL